MGRTKSPATPCARCGEPRSAHPTAAGCEGKWHGQTSSRASTSFSTEEISALEEVLRGLATGRDLRFVMRSKPMQAVARKVAAMRAQIDARSKKLPASRPDAPHSTTPPQPSDQAPARATLGGRT